MGRSRNAGAVIFGFEYQIDAAICLFLRDIKKISKIKVEGKYEDIEEFFEDGSTIYCQVKSVHNPQKTTASTKKLKEAIKSLSDCPIKTNDSLLYCSNQIDPLIKSSELFSANDILIYQYNELDNDSQNRIKNYFEDKSVNIYEKLSVIKIPYNVSYNIDVKRYFIIEEAKKFLIEVSEETAFSSGLVAIWHDYFINSTTSKDKEFYISKKEFVWIVIAHLLNKRINKIEIDDESLIEDVESKYENLIINREMNFEITSKIIGLYKEQNNTGKWSNINSFINYNSNELAELIYGDMEIDEIEKIALNAIVRSVIRMRTRIDRIKKGAKLC